MVIWVVRALLREHDNLFLKGVWSVPHIACFLLSLRSFHLLFSFLFQKLKATFFFIPYLRTNKSPDSTKSYKITKKNVQGNFSCHHKYITGHIATILWLGLQEGAAQGSCFEMMEQFCVMILIMVTWLYAFVKIHKTVQERVDFIAHKLDR